MYWFIMFMIISRLAFLHFPQFTFLIKFVLIDKIIHSLFKPPGSLLATDRSKAVVLV